MLIVHRDLYVSNLAARAQRVTFLAAAERREDTEMQRKIERQSAARLNHLDEGSRNRLKWLR
jgi:adenosyl cobinamide kinase/adenosyl cobinamide phosphate guanylyltransferase